jgi:hypothetical protein
MAKKRSAVSLRKPSPAPDADSLLTQTDATAQVETASEAETTQVLTVAREAAPEAPPVQQAMTVEAFVSGAAEALEKAVGEVPPARLLELLERGPAGYRELTVYLPQQLARDLSLHCMERDVDMNRLVAAALERHLGGSETQLDRRRLARVARALLVHLSRRAQLFWAQRRPGWGSAARSAVASA